MTTPILTTRRSLIAGAAAAGLLAPVAPARAIVPEPYHTLMRRVMGLVWIGTSRTPSDRFASGQFISRIAMQFDLANDWSFTGQMVEKATIEGRDYTGELTISGECWVIGDAAGLSIYKMKVIRGTPLPEPFAWGTSKGDFRFYNDSDRKGRFTLQGVLTDDNDRTQFTVSLIDAD